MRAMRNYCSSMPKPFLDPYETIKAPPLRGKWGQCDSPEGKAWPKKGTR